MSSLFTYHLIVAKNSACWSAATVLETLRIEMVLEEDVLST